MIQTFAADRTSAAAAFEKLGINLHELLYARTATAHQGDEQHRREQPRQAGGRVSYEPAQDVVPTTRTHWVPARAQSVTKVCLRKRSGTLRRVRYTTIGSPSKPRDVARRGPGGSVDDDEALAPMQPDPSPP